MMLARNTQAPSTGSAVKPVTDTSLERATTKFLLRVTGPSAMVASARGFS